MREFCDCGAPQAMAADKTQEAKQKSTTRITPGLAKLASAPCDNGESGINKKL
jgi:hypothetical protein